MSISNAETHAHAETSGASWPMLPPAALESVKSHKRTVLAFQLGCHDLCQGAKAVSELPSLTLSSRVAVALPADAAAALIVTLTSDEDVDASNSWSVWKHSGLRVAVLSGTEDPKQELAEAATLAPHVIVVHAETLHQADLGLSVALRAFKGAVLILQDSSRNAVRMVAPFAVTTSWVQVIDAAVAKLELASVPVPVAVKVIDDLKMKHLQEDALAPLVLQAEAAYNKYFHAGMLEEMASIDGSVAAFLVKDGEDGEQELVAFIVYKFWGPPLRAVCILRVGVLPSQQRMGYGKQLCQWVIERARKMPRSQCAKVMLKALASAVPFYERLHFEPTPPDDDVASSVCDDDSVHMHYKLGRAYVPRKRR